MKPAGDPNASTLILSSYYLGICGNLGSSGETDITIEVFVDGFDSHGNPNNVDAQEFDRTTNSSDPDNYELPIQVPEEGTYVVSVIVRGEACQTCCNLVNQPANGCASITNGGEIRFRGTTMTLNAKDLKPAVYVTPLIYGCNCGC